MCFVDVFASSHCSWTVKAGLMTGHRLTTRLSRPPAERLRERPVRIFGNVRTALLAPGIELSGRPCSRAKVPRDRRHEAVAAVHHTCCFVMPGPKLRSIEYQDG